MLKVPLTFKRGGDGKGDSESLSLKEIVAMETTPSTPVKRKSSDTPASIVSEFNPPLDKSTFFIICNKCGHSLCPVSQADVSNQHIIITDEQVSSQSNRKFTEKAQKSLQLKESQDPTKKYKIHCNQCQEPIGSVMKIGT